jgi:hypothetical protein
MARVIASNAPEAITPGQGLCAACGEPSPAGSLLCRPHWRMLPKPLRDDVWLALRRFRNGDVPLAQLRQAQQQAVDYVRETQETQEGR